MKKIKNNPRQKTAGAIAIISLALAAFPKTSVATPKATFSQGNLIAQASNCREIAPEVGLNVHQSPDGEVVGTLESEQNIYITSSEVSNGWVQIESPVTGYVRAEYLTYCDNATANPQGSTAMDGGGESIETVAGSNCRQVISPRIEVRKEPAGDVVATLEENQEVSIANEGSNGWVPIELPSSGFVRSSELGYCDSEVSQAQPTTAVTPQTATVVSQPPIGAGCRKVNMASGLNVRDAPGGNIIGSLEKDLYVYITDEGAEGWVPITKPMDGYVRSDELTYCP
ncbi:MAG: SH3 domain-containing protein [Cyanobacteriota bacterium]|nr:SH3 domain-containing protein [Cyanobacteriota bacterium]